MKSLIVLVGFPLLLAVILIGALPSPPAPDVTPAEAASVTCDGGYCPGTNSSDQIAGSSGVDDIDPKDGNDFVNAGSGGDTVRASDGTDSLWGMRGNDLLLGGPGPDDLHAGCPSADPCTTAGNDTLKGGDGDDTLAAKNGEYTVVRGMNGYDICYVDAIDDVYGCEEIR